MAFDGTLKFDTAIDRSGFQLGLDKLGSIAKVGMTAVAGAVTAAAGAVSALGLKSIDVGREFEAGMSQVQATLGLSVLDVQNNIGGAADTMQMLTDKAEEMGRTTQYTAAQAADGLNVLAMSGYDAESSIGMIGNVLNLAAAGNLSLADAASYAAGSMKGFVSEADGFADVTEASAYYADLIAKGATLAATDVQQLGEAMSQAAATADMYGQSSLTTEAALLRLAEQNETGSNAATMLAATMKNLYAPTDAARALFEELDFSAFDEATHQAKDFNAAVDELNAALDLKYADDAEAKIDAIQSMFGIQGAEGFSKMITASGETVQKFYAGLESASGSAALQAETMMDNLEGDITYLESAADGLYNAVYKSMNGTLRGLVQLGNAYVTELTEAFEAEGFEGLAERAGDVLGDAVTELSSYIPQMTSLGASLISSLTEGLAENAPSIAKTGITAALTLAEGIADASADLLDLGASLLTSLAEGTEKRLPRIRRIARDIVRTLGEALVRDLPVMAEAGLSILEMLGGVLLENLPRMAETGLTLLQMLAEGVENNLPALAEAAVKIITDFAGFIADHLPLLTGTALQMIHALTDTLLNAENLRALASAGYEVLTAIADAVTDNLPSLLDIAVQIVNFLCTELLTADNLGKLLDAGMQLLSVIVGAVIENLPVLAEAAAQILLYLAEMLSDPGMLFTLLEAGVQIILALADAIADNLDDILLAAEQIVYAIVDALTDEENVKQLVTIGAELLSGLLSGLGDIGGKLLGFAGRLFAEVWDALAEQDWESIGDAILEGIMSGFLGVDFDLDSYLDDFADNWLSGIKEIFGIHSPSKLMEEIVGKNLALGIGVGFTENIPDVGREAADAFADLTFPDPPKFDRPGSPLPVPAPEALEALRIQAPEISAGRMQPSPVTEIVNHYDYSSTVSSSVVNSTQSPQSPQEPSGVLITGDLIVPVNLEGRNVETAVISAIQIANAASGGNTI